MRECNGAVFEKHTGRAVGALLPHRNPHPNPDPDPDPKTLTLTLTLILALSPSPCPHPHPIPLSPARSLEKADGVPRGACWLLELTLTDTLT